MTAHRRLRAPTVSAGACPARPSNATIRSATAPWWTGTSGVRSPVAPFKRAHQPQLGTTQIRPESGRCFQRYVSPAICADPIGSLRPLSLPVRRPVRDGATPARPQGSPWRPRSASRRRARFRPGRREGPDLSRTSPEPWGRGMPRLIRLRSIRDSHCHPMSARRADRGSPSRKPRPTRSAIAAALTRHVRQGPERKKSRMAASLTPGRPAKLKVTGKGYHSG